MTKIRFDILGTTNKREYDENSETALRNKKIRMTLAKIPTFEEIHSAQVRLVGTTRFVLSLTYVYILFLSYPYKYLN